MRPDRVGEILADLALDDVEGGGELDVRDVVAAEVDVHEPGDEGVTVGVLVVLDALEQGVGAVADADDGDAHLVLRSGWLPFAEPLVAAIGVSFPRPPPKGTDRLRFDSKGTPSSSESAARMTSFVFEPRRNASAWIASFSSSGMRRSTTGLEPGSGLRRFVGT